MSSALLAASIFAAAWRNSAASGVPYLRPLGLLDCMILCVSGVIISISLVPEVALDSPAPFTLFTAGCVRLIVCLTLWFGISRMFRVEATSTVTDRIAQAVWPAVFLLFGVALGLGIYRGGIVLRDYYRAGAALQTGDYTTALEIFQRLREANRIINMEWVLQGSLQDVWTARQLLDESQALMAKSPAQAERVLQRVIDLSGRLAAPMTAAAHRALGDIYDQQDRPERAAEQYRQIIGLGITDAEPLQRAITLLHRTNDWENLASLSLEIEGIDIPDGVRGSPFFSYHVGRILFDQGRLRGSLRQFQTACALDVGFGDAHYRMGKVSEELGDADRAVHYYKQAIASIPTHLDALNALRRLRPAEGGVGTGHRQLDERIRSLLPPNSVRANLGGKIAFLGYDVEPAGDGKTRFSFSFQCIEKMNIDYVISLFGDVKDPSILAPDRVQHGSANFAHYPEKPTSQWQIGEVYRDDYVQQIKPGRYSLRFGLDTYTTPQGDQHFLLYQDTGDFWVRLGWVNVGFSRG